MYSQPFHSTFCKVLNLDTEGFPTPSCAVPMRDCDVGKVRIDDLHDLTVVVGELLKLEIKVVSSPDELRLRRIAFGGCEFLAEASFDDKTAAVMLKSGFAEQLVEADVLLLVKPERVLITRSFRLPGISVCLFSVGIHR